VCVVVFYFQSSSGFFGVDQDEDGPPGKWRAFIDLVGYDRHLIGYYDHAITAAKTYDEMARRIGAPLNFCEGGDKEDEEAVAAAARKAKAHGTAPWEPKSLSTSLTLSAASLSCSSSSGVVVPEARYAISLNGNIKMTSTVCLNIHQV